MKVNPFVGRLLNACLSATEAVRHLFGAADVDEVADAVSQLGRNDKNIVTIIANLQARVALLEEPPSDEESEKAYDKITREATTSNLAKAKKELGL